MIDSRLEEVEIIVFVEISTQESVPQSSNSLEETFLVEYIGNKND